MKRVLAPGESLPLMLMSALLLLVALVYWPGIGGGFIFDDFPNIVSNTALHVTTLDWDEWVGATLSSPASRFYRPLAMVTFAVNHYFTGIDPVPMKLTNIVIHLLNTVLVFGLVKAILAASFARSQDQLRAAWIALFCAACWALHPINLTAVLFVVQRMESLSHTFVFAGLWLYVLGRENEQPRVRQWVLVLLGIVGCTVLGLLAKESAALLPLYAACLELCIFKFRGKDGALDKSILALFLLVLILPAIAGLAWLLPGVLGPGSYSGREFTLAERLLTEPRVVLDYLRWIFWPDLGQLSLYHDDYVVSRSLWNPPVTAASIAVLAAVLAAGWAVRRRRPLLTLGILWFFGAQALTATFLPLELAFEHRNYFASLGASLVLADLMLVTNSRKLVRNVSALAIVTILSGLTYLRASEWQNPITFAIVEAAKHPNSPRATYYLAWTFARISNGDPTSPAIAPALDAFERARNLPGSGILPDQGAIVLAAKTGLPLDPHWWRHMQQHLRQRPIGPQDLGALGSLMKCSLEPSCPLPQQDMLDTFGAALSKGPHPEVLSIYGNYILNVVGDEQLALRLWQESSALDPTEPQYRISVIKLLIDLHRYDEAMENIAVLRKSGRFGQFAAMADALERRVSASKQARALEKTSKTP